MDDLVSFHFKRTDLIAPPDGQLCLVFNDCDGYRVAEWYEPGNCFLQFDETLSDHLATYWMEIPESAADGQGSGLCTIKVSQMRSMSFP